MELTLIFGSIALVAAVAALWWGLTARPSPARGNLFAGLPEHEAEQSGIEDLMRRLGGTTRRILPNALVDGLEVNLVQAGYPRGLDLPRLLGIKITLAAIPIVLFLVRGQPLLAIITAGVLYFLPDYWLLSTRDKRQKQIQLDAADIIDQLTICVEAGLGLDAAIARVASTTDGPLTDEFHHTMSDIRAGVPRAQALRALSDRVQIPEIRQLVSALLQAQKHGVPMADTLRIQSAQMRLKRTQRTEERAAKLTVKMLFPIIVCFLPVFMIIILVPSLINVAEAL
ncbi:MAG: type II secretion system F family protein [Ilumatobacteraceae bacterium]